MTEKFNNDDELRKMAPRLSELKRENPFQVPDSYFDSLADNIQQQIQVLPDFDKVAAQNPFNVPEGYFDSLPTAIQQRIIDERSERISVGRWIASVLFRPKFAVAFASVAVLLVFSVRYFSRTINVSSTASEISYTDLSNSMYLSDIDESVLYDALAEQSNSTTQKDESIEDYLIDNHIDVSQLTEHL
jgi:hypothetical protein